MAGFILLIFSSLTNSTALAQESLSSSVREAALLDAPQPAQVMTPPGSRPSQEASTGTLSGTVMDTNKDVLQGVRVTLSDASGSLIRTAATGDNGQFAFTALTPGVYKLTMSAPGMSPFTSTQITLHAGEFRIVPPITPSLARVMTSLTVQTTAGRLLLPERVR